jgi:hypothetical protein
MSRLSHRFRIRHAVLLALALVGSGIGAGLWLSGWFRPAEGSLQAVPPAEVQTALSEGPPGSATALPKNRFGDATSAESWRAQPLPPLDTPVLDMIEGLEARLVAGDARAGCRLAQELRRCHLAPIQLRAQSVHLLARRAERDAELLEQAIEWEARKALRREKLERVCAGLEREHFDRHFHVLRRTAELGLPMAMLDFADARGFLGTEFVRRPELLLEYRQAAPLMLQRALASGLPEAAYLALEAYSDTMHFLSELIEADPVEARAMDLLLASLWQGEGPALRRTSELDDASELRARQRVQELQATHFATPRTPKRLGRPPPDLLAVDPELCED